MRDHHASVALLGLVLVLAGCAAGRVEVPFRPDRGRPAAPAAADPFPYARGPVIASNHVLVEEETEDHVVRLLTIPSAGVNGQPGNALTARYYQRKVAAPQSLVIVLPIWGGHPYPSWIVAQDARRTGRGNVMLVQAEHPIIDWDAMGAARTVAAFSGAMQRMVERVRTSVIDVRRIIDWAGSRPDVDARRIGLVGFSESTLQVAGVVASDARVAAAVFVMGGAHPHEMMAVCYGPPALVRRQVLPRFGWSVPRYAAVLDPLLAPVDPARLGTRIDPARLLVIDAQEDDCIPARAREALWRALGHPERISVRSTHAGAFLAMTFLGGNHVRTAISRFLARTLE
jgi:dienelactone hydrolase